MDALKLVLVIVESNDYQAAQAKEAQATAQRLGAELELVHIADDAVVQSMEIVRLLQNPVDKRPHGIIFEPVGTPLAQAAKIAAAAHVGWVVLNREVEYLPEMRASFHEVPLFAVTTSHTEVGRIQGRQISRLLPNGGIVLHIHGPAGNKAALQRTEGMQETMPPNTDVRMLRAFWSEASAHQAVRSWLNLSISRELPVGVVAAQNDAMALGARKALQELTTGADRLRWLRTPFLGCDGLPSGGQAAVRKGLLAATVVIPPNAGQAVEALVSALQTGKQPPETIFTQPTSCPALDLLQPAG